MSNSTISEQNEKEQSKIQLLAFFLAVCLSGLIAICFLFDYTNNSYHGKKLVLDNKINPNFDTAASMARLPSLGSKKADAIVQFRQSGKIFDKPEDLDNVQGIGTKTIENIKPYLDFESK